MDKILSARVDEHTISELDMLARRLKTSKKAILENAIHAYAEQTLGQEEIDVLSETAGAWNRRESPTDTLRQAKKVFQDAFARRGKRR
jgi:predicted transcriptional regulator